MSTIDNLSPLEVLSLTIIGEARGEPIESQVAVGCVIRNRLHSNTAKYKDYKDVCLEPKQFSCWNEGDPNRDYLNELGQKMLDGQVINDPYLRQCLLVAHGIADWAIIDNTKGAMNYVTIALFHSPDRPNWTRAVANYVTRGNQVFFTAA